MCLGVGFLLKRENPAHFKNSDLTLSLKRGFSRSSEDLTASTASDVSQNTHEIFCQEVSFALLLRKRVGSKKDTLNPKGSQREMAFSGAALILTTMDENDLPLPINFDAVKKYYS
ncbi:hypothetical protein Lal_00039586 [Lupinus albus]|nr:hypothetical protein Lal_00039586 [Lupinus albus]